jgi:hypothetical protein
MVRTHMRSNFLGPPVIGHVTQLVALCKNRCYIMIIKIGDSLDITNKSSSESSVFYLLNIKYFLMNLLRFSRGFWLLSRFFWSSRVVFRVSCLTQCLSFHLREPCSNKTPWKLQKNLDNKILYSHYWCSNILDFESTNKYGFQSNDTVKTMH